jgi:hypothetical protein
MGMIFISLPNNYIINILNCFVTLSNQIKILLNKNVLNIFSNPHFTC